MTRALPLVAALLLLAAPAAAAKEYGVAAALGPELARVAAGTPVPVRLPARVRLDHAGRVYASGTARADGWTLVLAGARPCGANACLLASFSAERGGRPAFSRRLSLARGITGRYQPLRCGASCSPPQIQWLHDGVLYAIQAKLGVAGARAQRTALVRAANEAIAAPPR